MNQMNLRPMPRPGAPLTSSHARTPNISQRFKANANSSFSQSTPQTPNFNTMQKGNKKLDIDLHININKDGTVSANANQNNPSRSLNNYPQNHQFQQYPFHKQHLYNNTSYFLPQTPTNNLYQQNMPGNQNYRNYSNSLAANLIEDRVHCVVCSQTYLASQIQSHILKHKRTKPNASQNKIRNVIQNYSFDQRPQPRTIVQPQEFNIQYSPNKYVLNHEKKYATGHRNKPIVTNECVDTEDLRQFQLKNAQRAHYQDNITNLNQLEQQEQEYHPQPVFLNSGVQQQQMQINNHQQYRNQRRPSSTNNNIMGQPLPKPSQSYQTQSLRPIQQNPQTQRLQQSYSRQYSNERRTSNNNSNIMGSEVNNQSYQPESVRLSQSNFETQNMVPTNIRQYNNQRRARQSDIMGSSMNSNNILVNNQPYKPESVSLNQGNPETQNVMASNSRQFSNQRRSNQSNIMGSSAAMNNTLNTNYQPESVRLNQGNPETQNLMASNSRQYTNERRSTSSNIMGSAISNNNLSPSYQPSQQQSIRLNDGNPQTQHIMASNPRQYSNERRSSSNNNYPENNQLPQTYNTNSRINQSIQQPSQNYDQNATYNQSISNNDNAPYNNNSAYEKQRESNVFDSHNISAIPLQQSGRYQPSQGERFNQESFRENRESQAPIHRNQLQNRETIQNQNYRNTNNNNDLLYSRTSPLQMQQSKQTYNNERISLGSDNYDNINAVSPSYRQSAMTQRRYDSNDYSRASQAPAPIQQSYKQSVNFNNQDRISQSMNNDSMMYRQSALSSRNYNKNDYYQQSQQPQQQTAPLIMPISNSREPINFDSNDRVQQSYTNNTYMNRQSARSTRNYNPDDYMRGQVADQSLRNQAIDFNDARESQKVPSSRQLRDSARRSRKNINTASKVDSENSVNSPQKNEPSFSNDYGRNENQYDENRRTQMPFGNSTNNMNHQMEESEINNYRPQEQKPLDIISENRSNSMQDNLPSEFKAEKKKKIPRSFLKGWN